VHLAATIPNRQIRRQLSIRKVSSPLAPAGHQFVDEAEDAAGGVGRALAQPGMQQLAAVGPEGEQGMAAQPAGGAASSTRHHVGGTPARPYRRNSRSATAPWT